MASELGVTSCPGGHLGADQGLWRGLCGGLCGGLWRGRRAPWPHAHTHTRTQALTVTHLLKNTLIHPSKPHNHDNSEGIGHTVAVATVTEHTTGKTRSQQQPQESTTTATTTTTEALTGTSYACIGSVRGTEVGHCQGVMRHTWRRNCGEVCGATRGGQHRLGGRGGQILGRHGCGPPPLHVVHTLRAALLSDTSRDLRLSQDRHSDGGLVCACVTQQRHTSE